MKKSATDLSATTGYAGNRLDRLGNVRSDEAYVLRCLTDPAARYVLFAGNNPVLRTLEGRLSPYHRPRELSEPIAAAEHVLLGQDGDGPIFAAEVSPERIDHGFGAGAVSAEIDLRTLGAQGLLPRSELGILAQAKSVLGWHRSHRFCSNCGSETRPAQAGWRRDCGACWAQHFPRTDPVVIMLVTHEDECLLARQHKFVPGVYSCLAGFVEPGETIEDAVRREVMEEAGLPVGQVDYLASQPWPFPSSLMIGCHAHALGRDIVLDALELEDARWFGKADVRAMAERKHAADLTIPPEIAIARTLLDWWLSR